MPSRDEVLRVFYKTDGTASFVETDDCTICYTRQWNDFNQEYHWYINWLKWDITTGVNEVDLPKEVKLLTFLAE